MSDLELIQQDSDARQRALDPFRSFIVQAPAGSGKTELLTQRFLRLLTTVEHPEQVLAITFTRKAAAEMRARIGKALQLGAEETAPAREHTRQTWELARAVRAIDREREWHLLEHPSRLRIQTIDSLTSMLARRLPVLAGIGAALEPVDIAGSLYEAAALQLLERLGTDRAVSPHLETLIAHVGNRIDRLIELFVDLLARRDQWIMVLSQVRTEGDLHSRIEAALRGVVGQHIRALCDSLSEQRRRDIWTLTRFAAGNRLADASLDALSRALFEPCRGTELTPGQDSASLHAWRAVAKVFLTQSGTFYRKVNVRQGFPAKDPATLAMNELLKELADDEALCDQLRQVRTLPSIEYTPEQWRVLEALLTLLPQALFELQRVFQREGQADYVENALRALQALGPAENPTDLALAFDYRLRHILIDEFQDTSFTQRELLDRLTAGWAEGDGRTLFCVGDPMQSIYRFRQAEVGLFIQLQEHGLPNVRVEKLTLRRNFRSSVPVVTWVNGTFPLVFPRLDAAEQGAVRYSRSIAAVTSSEGGVHVGAMLDATLEDISREVVTAVQDALARDPDGSVAILVSGRNHLGLIADGLHEAGIEHRAVEIEPLRDRPVVQDLIALTRALVHLADRTAWLAVLRAPWCGLTLDDLHRLAAADRDVTVRELIARAIDPELSGDERIRLSAEGYERLSRVGKVLEAALAQRARHSLRDWVEKTWMSLAAPATLSSTQDLDDARAYFRRLDEIDTAGDLEDVTRLEEYLEGLCARPRTQTHARVDIMTIHKAKGLEFDTVILPGLERGVRSGDRPLLRWTRVAGLRQEHDLILAPLTAAGADTDPIYRYLELLEQERQDYERARLLYVAVTRARRDLYLFGNVQTKRTAEGIELKSPKQGSMLSMLWNVVRPAFEDALARAPVRGDVRLNASQTVPLRRLPLTWEVPAADPAVKVPLPSRIALTNPERPEFDWASEVSRLVGTLVHRELDRMTRLPSHQPSRTRVVAELRELGVPEDRCDASADRVLTAIENTLSDARGRWLLGREGSIRDSESELPLSGVLDGQIVNRIIDRTFIDADGTRWIVDFKTSTHEGGGLDAFLDAEVERYRPQLRRYAQLMQAWRPGEVVRAALYFPLLKEWREVRLSELEDTRTLRALSASSQLALDL